jgi:ferric-dicitrate binding protein FerR (iron transport regulator)
MIIIHKVAQCRPRLMGLPAIILSAGLVGVAACAPTPQLLRLADGTEIFYLSNTSVKPAGDYPRTRQIEVDGEAFIRAAAAAQPLIIRSRLLVLTVSGSSALRVTARSSETGEEADVLYGNVEARKAYPSPQSEPDTLVAGEEVMVNETVDLQEKETADVPALRSWSDALMASVARKNGR